jgi:MerR family transcriptional regulator, thiopeptide resistance regulator
MYTISVLAGKFNLSRSTLLYYDSIGLLHPSCRTDKGYRLYDENDRKRLEMICTLRTTGISLDDIKTILASSYSDTTRILQERLQNLNDEIAGLRTQQHFIIQLLGKPELLLKTGICSKKEWIRILDEAGLDKVGRDRWHREFERIAPQAHDDFLASLGIQRDEIDEIREWSRSLEE